MKLYLGDAEATAELARRLHAVLPADTAGWTLLLDGELGAGKSTFARALICAMGHRGAVPSPTYTLIEPYELPGRMVYHVDLYRIADEEELRFLGWTEIDDGLRIVEWPERAPELLASADLQLALSYANSGRNAELSALSARGEQLLGQVEAGPVTQLED